MDNDKWVCKSVISDRIFLISNHDECETRALAMNVVYQTDEYIIEPYDSEKVFKPFSNQKGYHGS